MANIPPGAPILWVHWTITIIVAVYTVALLRKYNLKSLCSRLEYLRNTQPQMHPVRSRTLLVTDLPGIPWNTMLDRTVRAVQGPLAWVTPVGVSQALEKKLAEKFWVGSGMKMVRSETAREKIETDVAPASLKTFEREEDTAAYDLESVAELDDHVSAWGNAKELLRSGMSVEEMIKSELERVHGKGSVVSVNVMASHDVLRSLHTKYQHTKEEVVALTERYSAAICRREERIPIEKLLVVGPMYGSWGTATFGNKPKVVDALQFHCMRLEQLGPKLQERKFDAEMLAEPTAFVTFRSLSATAIAGTSLHHQDTSTWQFHPAPQPQDVIWANLGYRLWERRTRGGIVAVLFGLACVFYVIPVAGLQTILVDDLLNSNPFLVSLQRNATIRALLLLVLPTLGLVIVLTIMPPLLALASRWRGVLSDSQVTWDTVNNYFYFKVVVLFIGSLVSGAVIYISVLSAIIVRPLEVLDLLGATAPRLSFYFISFILTEAFILRPLMTLVDPMNLINFYHRVKNAQTPKAKEAAVKLHPNYGLEIPMDTLTILLGVVFSVQNPMLPLAAAVCMIIAGSVFRYNWLYKYRQTTESGGLIWSTMADQIFVGLTVFLAFMIGYFQLLKCTVQSTLLIPVLIGVILFWIASKRQMGQPQQFLSLDESRYADERFPPLEPSDHVKDIYTPPFMKDDSEEVMSILDSARRVQNALQGDMQATREIQQSSAKGV